MYDPLRRPEIVLSIQTCFATDSPDFSDMNKLHNLIASMCTHPDDETVQILENGVSDRARFSFKMFRFTESFSYIYLHCEVKVCNSTAETCVGSQGLCHGGEWERKKRSAEEAAPSPGDTQQFISRGPLIAYMQENAGEGRVQVESNQNHPLY
ncbi:unnamed protein product [Oikopleura dioica]|uniref:ZP domain-containing protein n=1 Tax=Oikopleura dioica TaxID=34765 RepID=E4XBF5_OIKDI|nr:unnamed protein product [Oikopleura dioica]